MFEILAAPKDSTALLKCLTYVELAKHGLTNPQLSATVIKDWVPTAHTELVSLKVNKSLLDNLVKAASKKDVAKILLEAKNFKNGVKTLEAWKAAALEADGKKREREDRSWNESKLALLTSLLSLLPATLEKESKSAMQKLKKEVGSLSDQTINKLVPSLPVNNEEEIPVVETSTGSTYKKLQALTKGVAKTAASPFLAIHELTALKDSNPDFLTKYKALTSPLMAKFKDAVRAYVNQHRTEEEPYSPLKDVYKAVVPTLGYNAFMKGNYNDPDIYISSDGKVAVYNGIVKEINLINPTAVFERNKSWVKGSNENVYPVRYCTIVAPGTTPAEMTNNAPLAKWNNKLIQRLVQDKKKQKFEDVTKALPHASEFISRWREDLTSDTDTAKLASMAELAYLTSMRLQIEGGTSKGQETVGIATIKVENLILTKDSFDLKFLAKSLRQQHKAKTLAEVKKEGSPEDVEAFKQLLKNLASYVKGKKPSDRVFTKGDKSKLPDTVVKNYISKVTGGALTAHPLFRHLKAETMFKEGFAKFPDYKPPLNTAQKKEVKEKFDKLTKEIGDELGHQRTTDQGTKSTGATAISFYIPLTSIIKYYSKYRLPIPNGIMAKAIEQGIPLFQNAVVDNNDKTYIVEDDSSDSSDSDTLDVGDTPVVPPKSKPVKSIKTPAKATTPPPVPDEEDEVIEVQDDKPVKPASTMMEPAGSKNESFTKMISRLGMRIKQMRDKNTTFRGPNKYSRSELTKNQEALKNPGKPAIVDIDETDETPNSPPIKKAPQPRPAPNPVPTPPKPVVKSTPKPVEVPKPPAKPAGSPVPKADKQNTDKRKSFDVSKEDLNKLFDDTDELR